MAPIVRKATGEWSGDLKGGKGLISGPSGVLNNAPFTYGTRFENAKGTSPEELIAAAHAACYSMAFANYLSKQGHIPERINTEATITVDSERTNKMHLSTRGSVEGLDDETFKRLAVEAEKQCPISNLLRNCLEISLDASLES